MKRYYVSTTDYSGNFNGLLHAKAKGVSTDDLSEAKLVFKRESEYLNSHYVLSENDGEGYFCSIFDNENVDFLEMTQNYDVR